mmetsp:Transcript_20282/g.43453  ORF Transcript_20282/g.43453 Transcript_20282/m.43453 type:complete len:224 (+) Transcript_20282:1156-1827(+)
MIARLSSSAVMINLSLLTTAREWAPAPASCVLLASSYALFSDSHIVRLACVDSDFLSSPCSATIFLALIFTIDSLEAAIRSLILAASPSASAICFLSSSTLSFASRSLAPSSSIFFSNSCISPPTNSTFSLAKNSSSRSITFKFRDNRSDSDDSRLNSAENWDAISSSSFPQSINSSCNLPSSICASLRHRVASLTAAFFLPSSWSIILFMSTQRVTCFFNAF